MKDHCPRCLSPWDQTLDEDHCPRCLSPWDQTLDEYVCLTKCGMSRLDEIAPGKGYIFILKNIIMQGDLLVWYPRPKYYCIYCKPPEFNEGINLPYLKFDIEADKLKLYLTFS